MAEEARRPFVGRGRPGAAVDAAKSQHTTVQAQHLGELIVASLAQEIITLDKELADLDTLSIALGADGGRAVAVPDFDDRPRNLGFTVPLRMTANARKAADRLRRAA